MKVTRINVLEEITEGMGGYSLLRYTRDYSGKITAIRTTEGQVIALGQRVHSNGIYGVPKDTFGIVTDIKTRYSDCALSDVTICVWFEASDCATDMKFYEIREQDLKHGDLASFNRTGFPLKKDDRVDALET